MPLIDNGKYFRNRLSLIAVLFLFFSLLVPPVSFSKAVLYEGRDGLSNDDINTITKDRNGLMWIGTLTGLDIYDGYTFTKLPGELATLNITALVVNNSRNELLASTNRGLFSVDLGTLKIAKIGQEDKAGKQWSNTHCYALYIQPGTDNVYMSFEGGYLGKLNRNHKIELILRGNDTASNFTDIVQGPAGSIIGNNGTLQIINPKLKTGTPISQVSKLALLTAVNVHDTQLVISGYSSGLNILDMNTFADAESAVVKRQKKLYPYFTIQAKIHKNKLYTLYNNYTLVITDLQNGTITEVSKKYPAIFEGRVGHFLFIDEHDVVWIATKKGLIKLEERPVIFTRELSNLPDRVSTRKIIEEPNGDLYICSYVGLWHFSKQSETWTKYSLNSPEVIKSNPQAFAEPVFPCTILQSRNPNYFYIGFDYNKLLRFDKRRKVFENLPYAVDKSNIKVEGIYCLEEDKYGIVWIGCRNGLASYNPILNKLTLHRNDAFSIGAGRVRYILENRQKDLLYVAATTGLYFIDLNRGLSRHFNTTSKPALTNDDVLYIGKDTRNNLWLGTNGGGINILAEDLSQVQVIRKQHGLSSDVVYSMVPEDENTYWISTFNGLDCYRKDKKSFSNFFEEDGLSSNEFNQNSFLKTRDGKIYFGSINGVTSFYPQLFSEPAPFSIFLSGISKWDEQTQTVKLISNRLDSNSKLVKRPSDLLFEMHFACTDYSDPLRNTYSYRIKELSDNWISLEDRHTLNLGGMSYGNYTLEVKAINSRGASSTNVLVFHIIVVQPFYKTWWFFALLLTGIALIFYAAYLLKSQNFNDILHLRMKIASNLHDEVGSLLTRITMFSDNLRYGKNTEEQRNQKLDKIAVLSRDAVASMSDVLWAIDSRNDFAGNLLDRMREHTEDMLFPLGIDVNFVLSGTDLRQPISADMRGEIYLIFKEAINNIAKHSEAKNVDIHYQVTDKSFLLNIANDGVKNNISEISTGQGLNNMKMRAAKAGVSLSVNQVGEIFSVEIKN